MGSRRSPQHAPGRSVDDRLNAFESSSASLPSVAAVVPCHNSSESLEFTLGGLKDQRISPNEIICVDDNSSSTEAYRQERLAHSHGARYLRLPYDARHRGRRSLARNAGTTIARAEVILYVDSDMVLSPDYVANLQHLHSVHPSALVKGTRIDVDEPLPVWPGEQELQKCGLAASPGAEYGPTFGAIQHFPQVPSPSQSVSRQDEVGNNVGSTAYVSGRWDWCASNNLSVRRRHVVAAGGWDERFIGWGEEDIEFAYRLFLLGIEPIVQVNGPLRALHLNHVVNTDANGYTLKHNGLYFLRKFPEVLAWRRLVYEEHGITSDELEAFSEAP